MLDLLSRKNEIEDHQLYLHMQIFFADTYSSMLMLELFDARSTN